MSHGDPHVFDPECRGCQPALMDVKTGFVLPDDHPNVVATMEVWRSSTREEQEAFHKVCVLSSRDPAIWPAFERISQRIQAALKAVG